jgi:Copper transport outer membrane protein, MctB
VINFRFHLVSIVAVFLALAIGIVMGYGVLGQPTVDTLQDRIDVVEANAEERRVENDELRAQLDQQGTAMEQSAPFAVSDRVGDVRALVLAVRGIDEDAVARVIELARRGGAEAPGIIWLESKWALESRDDVTALATALGLTATGKRAPLRADAFDALVTRLSTGASPIDTDALRALVDAGFVTLDGAGTDAPAPASLGGIGTRAVLVTGAAADVPARLVVTPIARVAVDEDLPLVAGELFPDGTEDAERGDSLTAIRDDDTLEAEVSTVDDVERVEGAVATVLALADLGRGVVGHYGVGDGTERQLPEWWQL